ncbi:C-X-C chemokine receptor type 5-like [Mugil cephalus]|uniref:C-X-C chemokine receptor type 5-like n=1 Tax=Mugil cephalus TaxID=48193 RepID=UPI001FB6E1A0|nr:C-X-C chemokine receptor type 5-like [Mugil cephalus]XP_047453628.1 C-X-C chemokine receptor type 5-like [Mugil cephalus]XP_047453629.1 C-X-C chemokine receptor type 5-like [Mugil cephalus]
MALDLELHGIFEENSTYMDYEDYEYKEESEPSSSNGVIFQILYAVVMIVGLLGNVLLLVVLARRRRPWRSSDIFIVHLAVADILLLCTLPFWVAQFGHCGWCTEIACKLCLAVFNINFFCGIFLLICLSLDHYLSALRQIKFNDQRKRLLVHIGCLLVWLISVILTIPGWLFPWAKNEQGHEKTQCIHSYPLLSRQLHHTLGFGIPGSALVFGCICIFLELKRSLQRPAMVILPLVVVFLLCWMPFNITLIVDTFKSSSKEPHKDYPGNSEGSLTTALLFTSALGFIHACLRPLLYFVLCGNFRKQILVLLRCSTVESESSLWKLVEGAPQSNHNTEGQQLKQLNSEDKMLSADEKPLSQVI